FQQEGPDLPGREILHTEPVDRLADAAGDEGQEQTQRVAVALLRVAGQVPLADKVLQQEAPHPWAQQGAVSHDSPPLWHSPRSGRWLRPTVRVSCSDKPRWRRDERAPGRPTARAATSARLPLADTRTSIGGPRRCAAGRADAAGNARRRSGGCRPAYARAGSKPPTCAASAAHRGVS